MVEIVNNKDELLHIYAQDAWHDHVEVFGTKESLTALRDLIDKALKSENEQAESGDHCFMTSDGEGYGIFVRVVDNDWDSFFWQNAELPYTFESMPYMKSGFMNHVNDEIERRRKNGTL